MSEHSVTEGADPDTVRVEVISFVGRLLAEWDPDVRIDQESRCDEVGIDSMILMVVFSDIERRYQVEFDNAELGLDRYPTVGDLAYAVAVRVCSRR